LFASGPADSDVPVCVESSSRVGAKTGLAETCSRYVDAPAEASHERVTTVGWFTALSAGAERIGAGRVSAAVVNFHVFDQRDTAVALFELTRQ
jgi:hypothetical protein